MKYYLIIALIAFTGAVANAQTKYRTDESIRSQIQNGTAPGFLFRKSAPAKKEKATEPVYTGSLGKQLRENSMPGMTYQKTTPGKTNATSPVQTKTLPGNDPVVEAPKPAAKSPAPGQQ